MAFTWNENLAVGVEEIDEQHREIFSRFDKLSLACQEQHGGDVVKELIDFLHEYVVHHFAAEEALMEKLAYPGLAVQIEQHAAFRKDLDKLTAENEQGMDAHKFSLTLDRRLVQWFILHIRNLDNEMAQYVKSHKN